MVRLNPVLVTSQILQRSAFRWFAATAAVALCPFAFLRSAQAQALAARPTPLSAWLDLRPAAPEAAPQAAPTWIEAFEYVPAVATETIGLAPQDQASDASPEPAKAATAESIYRIRLHRPAAAVSDLQVRIFYQDRAGTVRPHVSLWNELGTELMRSDPLGQGLGLPSSETLVVPMDGADYLELSAPGDGSQLRAVFLTWLEKTEVQQPADFRSREIVREPFQILPAVHAPGDDSYLYGVVTARLQGSEALLLKSPDAPAAAYEFQLERQPLVAVVSYEVLGATLGAAPTISLNGQPAVASEVYLPDLADPGYRGETREGSANMDFHYTGWVRAQKVIAGNTLAAGLNDLTIALSNESGSVAIRSVQVQLKYNWEKLDYVPALIITPHIDSYDAP